MSDDQLEILEPPAAHGRSRRTAVFAGVAVAAVAVLGSGAYAAYSFVNGGGPQPADVLPDSTVAVVSIDLDPSAGQKIAAIKSIRKFPTLKKVLGLKADDDLRKYVFDKVTEASDCAGLDFDSDVEPWLGKRAAFAGVDLGGSSPAPVIALQISDPEKAKAGFDAIVRCTDPEDFAFVVGDDYLIASDTADHARTILTKGADDPLADDAAYRKWTGEVGDAGVLNFYVSKRAAGYAENLLDDFGSGFADSLTGEGSSDSLGGSFDDEDFGSGAPDPLASARGVLDDFEGLGGTVRFAGGGMELSIAGGGVDQLSGLASVGKAFGELPGDTAAAIGFGVSDDYADTVVEKLGPDDDMVAQAEKETGLDFPDDLQTLLGKAVVLSLGGDAPDSLDAVQGIEDVPAGLVIHGDADRIKDLIATAEDHLGVHLTDVPVVLDSSNDKVAIATSEDYARELLKSGSLRSTRSYRDAVPDADRAGGILYLDFDSKWRQLVVDAVTEDEGRATGAELDANLAPLRSLGVSSWQDGGVSHALVKLATD
jgi:hypothetical protein